MILLNTGSLLQRKSYEKMLKSKIKDDLIFFLWLKWGWYKGLLWATKIFFGPGLGFGKAWSCILSNICEMNLFPQLKFYWANNYADAYYGDNYGDAYQLC